MISQSERIEYCRICTKRYMNLKVGLLCSLTNEKPDFNDTCISFHKDEGEATRVLALKMDGAANVDTPKGTTPKQNRTIGILALTIGILASVVPLVIGFGTYVVVAYGAIIYGISRIIKGRNQERILQQNKILENKINQMD